MTHAEKPVWASEQGTIEAKQDDDMQRFIYESLIEAFPASEGTEDVDLVFEEMVENNGVDGRLAELVANINYFRAANNLGLSILPENHLVRRELLMRSLDFVKEHKGTREE